MKKKLKLVLASALLLSVSIPFASNAATSASGYSWRSVATINYQNMSGTAISYSDGILSVGSRCEWDSRVNENYGYRRADSYLSGGNGTSTGVVKNAATDNQTAVIHFHYQSSVL